MEVIDSLPKVRKSKSLRQMPASWMPAESQTSSYQVVRTGRVRVGIGVGEFPKLYGQAIAILILADES